ncbi:MAG TPA: YIP1 family protein [Pyrinomonadaceae bacterium]|nr:YIP1 family protein [Pyrinomonadaceae bacterium]
MVRRNYALIVLGVGLVVVVLSLVRVLPRELVGAGAALAFFGLILTGLSFIRPYQPPPDAPAPLSAFERIAGLFYEPTRVFQNLRAHPRWLAALAVIVLLSFVYVTAFTRRLTPERIVGFNIDKVVESGWMPAEMGEEQKREQIAAAKRPTQVVSNAVNQFVFGFIFMVISACLYMLGVLVFGGRINFWQALAVTVHAWLPPAVIGSVLSLLILFLKDPAEVHPIRNANGLVQDNLSVLFNPAARPVLYTLASFISVLSFYRLWLLATGLRNGGERVNSTAAWSAAVAVWLIGVILAVALAAIAPGFIA